MKYNNIKESIFEIGEDTMNKNKKQKKIIVAIILIISLIVGVTLYNNFANNKVVENSAANEIYKVALSEENCNIKIDGNTSTIEKYNGNADTVVINKEDMPNDIVSIDSSAFLECGNLSKILIDKSIASENVEIENFEKSNDYEDEKFCEGYESAMTYVLSLLGIDSDKIFIS